MESRLLHTRTMRRGALPQRLYEEAKEAGTWNPAQLDFSIDRAHWKSLRGETRVPVLAMAVLTFHGLQVRLHNDSLLMMAIDRHGTIGERLCLSSLIFETARQVEFYNLLLEDILHLVGDPERFYEPHYRRFIDEAVPTVMDRLCDSSDPAVLIEALTLDGPIGKGVLGMTSLFSLETTLARLDILPTTRRAIQVQRRAYLRRLEFANYYITKLLGQDSGLWRVVDNTLQSSFEPTVGIVREFFDRHSRSVVTRAEAVTYAVEQFSQRYEQLELARNSQLRSSAVPREGQHVL